MAPVAPFSCECLGENAPKRSAPYGLLPTMPHELRNALLQSHSLLLITHPLRGREIPGHLLILIPIQLLQHHSRLLTLLDELIDTPVVRVPSTQFLVQLTVDVADLTAV